MAYKPDKLANAVLSKRINNPAKHLALENLKISQEKNDFDVVLSAVSGRRLKGAIVKDGKVYKEYKEGLLSSLLSSPVKFIEKLCKEADKTSELKKI